MTLISDVIPPREPSMFEFCLDLTEVDIVNKALAKYLVGQISVSEQAVGYDIMQGFTAAYLALRADEEKRLADLYESS